MTFYIDPRTRNRFLKYSVCDLTGKKEIYGLLCLGLTFYLKKSFFANKTGIVKFNDQCLKLIGDKAQYFALDNSRHYQNIANDVFEMVPWWYTFAQKKRSTHALIVESGWYDDVPTNNDALSDFAFKIEYFQDRGCAALYLPLGVLENIESSYQLAEKLTRFFNAKNLIYGRVGLFVRFDEPGYHGRDHYLQKLFKEFPGVEYDHAFDFVDTWDKIPSVNWLTILGEEYTDKIKPKLEKISNHRDVEKKLTVRLVGKRAIIRAGLYPSLCGKNEPHSFGLYRQAYQCVKELMPKSNAFDGYETIAGNYKLGQWCQRFKK